MSTFLYSLPVHLWENSDLFFAIVTIIYPDGFYLFFARQTFQPAGETNIYSPSGPGNSLCPTNIRGGKKLPYVTPLTPLAGQRTNAFFFRDFPSLAALEPA